MAKKRKIILITVIVLFAGVAIAVPVVRHYSEPNFANMSPRDIRQYFDSNEFRDANEDQRRQVGEKMRDAMEARMDKQVNGYFAIPEGDQRTAYLDNIIDEMQNRRAEFMANRDPNRFDPNRPFDPNRFRDPNRPFDPNRFGRFGNGQRPQMNPEQMRDRAGGGRSADSRVKQMQFRRAMADRMAQRGIQMGPGGRGGFGGGQGGPGGGFGGPGGPGGGQGGPP